MINVKVYVEPYGRAFDRPLQHGCGKDLSSMCCGALIRTQ